MKTKEEIKQLVYKTFGKESYRGYANEQCEVIANFCYDLLQEQLAEKEKELSEVKLNPNYAKKGDYCAVCGCKEFWNDEEE